MAADTIQNDLVVLGQLSSKTIVLPAGSVTDANVSIATPAVQATKLQHQYEEHYAQSSLVTVAADQFVFHVVRGTTAQPLDFKSGCVTPCTGNATITVDLWRNGVTVLTATISLSSAQAAYALVAAAGFSVTSWNAGDVIEAKITTAVGTGVLGKGVFCNLHLREDPQ